MAVLGLRFCARAFPSCGKWGPLFIAVRGPLTIAASLVVEHRLQTRRLSSCGSRAQSLRGMWDLPRPGLEPVSPASAGRFSTTAPPGKPSNKNFFKKSLSLRQMATTSFPISQEPMRPLQQFVALEHPQQFLRSGTESREEVRVSLGGLCCPCLSSV